MQPPQLCRFFLFLFYLVKLSLLLAKIISFNRRGFLEVFFLYETVWIEKSLLLLGNFSLF
ncbi:unnamed protein product [Brugia timori]|uniref:Uncharacterized protein n=1 Tax=Brugia timori TaxID=42155 RepID=A0A0R3QFS9_9BILA|nr:unnamed protein product [Brugia timori]